MKKIWLSAALAATLLIANAQNTMQDKKTEKKSPTKKEMKKGKEHACTVACKEGKHALAHGEKGHVCVEACHKKM